MAVIIHAEHKHHNRSCWTSTLENSFVHNIFMALTSDSTDWTRQCAPRMRMKAEHREERREKRYSERKWRWQHLKDIFECDFENLQKKHGEVKMKETGERSRTLENGGEASREHKRSIILRFSSDSNYDCPVLSVLVLTSARSCWWCV